MVLSHRIERSSLKVGDHIYAWRIAYTYSHHGIFIGDDTVIHFTRGGVLSLSLDDFLDGSKLRRYKYASKPTSVVSKLRGTCTTAASDDGDTVVHRAKQLLEKGFGRYNLGTRNCENFAVYCKTGLHVVNAAGDGEDIAGLCSQVAAVRCKAVVVTTFAVPVIVMGAAVAASGTVAVGVTAAALAALAAADLAAPAAFAVVSGGVVFYCKRRRDEDIGIRSDVMKKGLNDKEEAEVAATTSCDEAASEDDGDYRNWTTEHVDGAAMEDNIPSPSLQLLSDLSKHFIPGGYSPDALLIPPHIEN